MQIVARHVPGVSLYSLQIAASGARCFNPSRDYFRNRRNVICYYREKGKKDCNKASL